MNDRFVAQVERAIANGFETRPQETEEARQRREHAIRDGAFCADCGRVFHPFRGDMRYCSRRCQQRAAAHRRYAVTKGPHDPDREVSAATRHR